MPSALDAVPCARKHHVPRSPPIGILTIMALWSVWYDAIRTLRPAFSRERTLPVVRRRGDGHERAR